MSTETAASRFETIEREPTDVDAWIVPPACRGRMIERAYAADEDWIYKRATDTSLSHTATERVTYSRRPWGEDETFEPWNYEPDESA